MEYKYITDDKKRDNLRMLEDTKNECEELNIRINLEVINEYREQYGFTLKDLAYYLGLKSPEMYYRRERGQIAFTAVELMKLTYLYDLQKVERLIKMDF